MVYSTTTLLKLQRLARAAKKELNLVTQLSSESDVAALMFRVSTEHGNAKIVGLLKDLKATLTVEEIAMLSDSGVTPSALPILDEIEGGASTEEATLLNERVYRGVVIQDDEAKDEMSGISAEEEGPRKQRMYRGVVMEDDIAEVIEKEKRVKTEMEVQARIQAEVDAQVTLKMAVLKKMQAPAENLITFPKDPATPAAKPMRKQVGTYRGQPVYKDVE